MKETLLEIQNLTYHYDEEKTALKEISFIISKGEKIAVMGANGAGKSTLFLNMNGVLTPDHGEIIYKGKQINKKNINELRKNVGIVFQDADHQIIASTVRGEVSFGPMNLKLTKQEVVERVDEALEYMNLTPYRDRPPHYLSGGEKKRVSIADIIAMKSEMIIFDEPTASLDPVNTMMLEDVLGKLSEEGKTMLISTHDIDFAYRWAERMIVFCEGKLIADGTPLEVFKNEKILEQANLKRPTLLDVYELLIDSHHLKDEKSYPRTIEELKKVVHRIRNKE